MIRNNRSCLLFFLLVFVLPILVILAIVWLVVQYSSDITFNSPAASGELERLDEPEVDTLFRPLFMEALSGRIDSGESAVYAREGDPVIYLHGGEGYLPSPRKALRRTMGDLPTNGGIAGIHYFAPDSVEGAVYCGTITIAQEFHDVCGWANLGSMAFLAQVTPDSVETAAREHYEPLVDILEQFYVDSGGR
jgi:hypothetical protein